MELCEHPPPSLQIQLSLHVLCLSLRGDFPLIEGQFRPLCSMLLPSQKFEPFIHFISLFCVFNCLSPLGHAH